MRHLLVLLLLSTAAMAETEGFTCDSAEGFSVTNFTDVPPAGASLSAEAGAVVLRYDRANLAAITHAALLSEMTGSRISVLSHETVTLALVIPDRDGARWMKGFPVPGGVRTELVAAPADFQLTDDSPVKKAHLEPERLGLGYILFDIGPLSGASGANVLAIEEVTVSRSDPAVSEGDLVVDGPREVRESMTVRGNLRIRAGGSLKVSAPRFTVTGDVLLEGGSLDVVGGVFQLPQRFNHERKFDVREGARLSFERALVITLFPAALEVANGAAYDSDGTEQVGGMTASLSEHSVVNVTGATGINEFVIPAGAACSFRDCKFLILWFTLGANLQGGWSFPAGGHVGCWTAGAGHRTTVTSCDNVYFCLVSNPGAKGEVADSEVYGAGLFFMGEEPVTLSGLENRKKVHSLHLAATDRDLTFLDTTVQAWTIYPALKAHVTVERCVIGETLAFGEAREEISDSTCDGTGGYFGTSQTASIHAVRCKITCLVVARDESSIVLEDCEVVGDVRAAGKATVKLVRCKVTGRIEKDPGATITEE